MTRIHWPQIFEIVELVDPFIVLELSEVFGII